MSDTTTPSTDGAPIEQSEATPAPGFWNYVGFWFPHVVAVGYAGVIASAIFIQFSQGDLPCPLCTLQRFCMILVAIAATWVVGLARKGLLTPDKYARTFGLMMIGALLGTLVSTRQVLLHIQPDDPGYGDPLLGLHLYTWALVTFFVVLVYSAVMLTLTKQTFPVMPKGAASLWISRILIWIFIAIVIINVILIFTEQGFNWVLPDDPSRYELLYDLGIKN